MKKIRVGLFGFGKTGKLVAGEFIKDDRFDLKWVVKRTKKRGESFASRLLGYETKTGAIHAVDQLEPRFFAKNPVDVLVDFSSAQGYRGYAAAPAAGVRIITAISKYAPEDLAALKAMAKKTAVLVSPNITLGINFLLVASQVLQKIAPHADIEIAEVLGLEKTKHVNSIRVGGIVGRHEVVFGLPNQTIRLVHESISRAAFGQGAIFGALWLADKGPGLYTMEQIVADKMGRNIPIF